MRLILILTHSEYEHDMRLRCVSNGIGRVAENAFGLSCNGHTSSRPGGTVPKCNAEWSTTVVRSHGSTLKIPRLRDPKGLHSPRTLLPTGDI